MDDEVPDPDTAEVVPRPPREEDLVALCRRLNELSARYVVVGGWAIIHAGYPRMTGDIDLIVDASLENEAKIYEALEIFPDKAVRELKPGEVSQYIVVRVANEVLVDLMASAGGVDYEAASKEIQVRDVQGVPVPFASPRLLYRMKCRTNRAKDEGDLHFLRQLLTARGERYDDL